MSHAQQHPGPGLNPGRTVPVMAAVWLAGCLGASLSNAPPPSATATPPAPTLAAATTPTLSGPPVEAAPGLDVTTLTVWMPEGFEPGEKSAAGKALAEQVLAFDEARPDIQVDFYPKRVRGAGGITAYLRSAPPVAPGVLPDLTLLDRDSLADMSREKLLVPIGTLVDPAVVEGLYPVARAVGTIDGDLTGLPYLLEMDHAVYRLSAFRKPPVSYQMVLDDRQPISAPAGASNDVAPVALVEYLAEGGTLQDESGKPALNTAALITVLTYYDNARKLGVFENGNFQFTSAEDSWVAFRDQDSNLALVTSTVYLSHFTGASDAGLMPPPTAAGTPFTLVRGWSWAIITHDPVRQAAAMALVNFLMNPVTQGRYSEAAGWLPSQPGALAVWAQDDGGYQAFAGQMLDSGQAMPDVATRSIVAGAVQDAFEAVLLTGVPPADAAARAEAVVAQASP
jgi:ABC-type glycerol-3-phosphate transport system substrate-binding protein